MGEEQQEVEAEVEGVWSAPAKVLLSAGEVALGVAQVVHGEELVGRALVTLQLGLAVLVAYDQVEEAHHGWVHLEEGVEVVGVHRELVPMLEAWAHFGQGKGWAVDAGVRETVRWAHWAEEEVR